MAPVTPQIGVPRSHSRLERELVQVIGPAIFLFGFCFLARIPTGCPQGPQILQLTSLLQVPGVLPWGEGKMKDFPILPTPLPRKDASRA